MFVCFFSPTSKLHLLFTILLCVLSQSPLFLSVMICHRFRCRQTFVRFYKTSGPASFWIRIRFSSILIFSFAVSSFRQFGSMSYPYFSPRDIVFTSFERPPPSLYRI